jgi:hypothetical protein
MDNYVSEYFSVARFRIAYVAVIKPMTDKSQWGNANPGFKILPPKMKRPLIGLKRIESRDI